MSRIKVAVAGAGLIAQLEHIPNLLFLKSRYEVIGVADPSAKTRTLIQERHGLRTYPSVEELLATRPDAVVIAAPDSYHAEIAGTALDAGIHVFCEKPLSLSVADIDDLIRRRDASRRVLQVGYMKRWDPSYELLLEEVDGLGDRLRFIAVEVNDPDSWPFSQHQEFFRADDVPRALAEENKARLVRQVERAIGAGVDDAAILGYAESYASSMIHDLNVVMGLLERMNISNYRPISGSIFCGGRGTGAVMAINGSQAIAQLSHVVVPKLANYQERISLFFDDRRFELVFPSPYLNHFPTRLTSFKSDGMKLSQTEQRNGFQEPFVRELVGFWDAIVSGAKVRNTAEHARRDIAMVSSFAKLALGRA